MYFNICLEQVNINKCFHIFPNKKCSDSQLTFPSNVFIWV